MIFDPVLWGTGRNMYNVSQEWRILGHIIQLFNILQNFFYGELCYSFEAPYHKITSMKNQISFELSASNQFLSDLFESALDDAVASEPLEVNSVEVVLKRIGEAELKPDHKSMHIYLPLDISLKRPAGLFTVEGNGSISLHLVVDFDINQNLQLSAKTDLISHEWLEKPTLEIGALNIPVETLVNMVLKHHESILTAKIDAALKEVSDLNKLLLIGLDKAKDNLNKQDLKGNSILFLLHKVALEEPILQEDRIRVRGILEPTIKINADDSKIQENVAFEWRGKTEETSDRIVQVDAVLPYDLLKSEMKEALQGMEVNGRYFDVRSIDIHGGEKLMIRLVIHEPIKAEVFIEGRPVYNEIEGELVVNDLDVKVNPANFIYKLTAPFVNKFVEGKMEEFFPLEVNQKMSEIVRSNIPKEISIPKGIIKVSHDHLTIDELDFGTESIIGKTSITNLNVEVQHH